MVYRICNTFHSMVSIIVSAFKDRGWLDGAIQSAINQDFKDKEVILSSDGNWQLKSFAEKYGIGFCCSPKGNHATALNNAMQMCSGTWVKEVADDDELLPDCVSNLMTGIVDCDIVYGNAINVYADHDEYYKNLPEIVLSDFLPVITNLFHAAAFMVRRTAFINAGGFDVNLRIAEDYEFIIRMIKKQYIFKYVDKYVCRYRFHDNQMTGLNKGELRQSEANYINKKHRI